MERKEFIRTFIAVPVTLPELLIRVQDELKETLRDEQIRWVDRSHMHLTLRFLGEVSVDDALWVGKQMHVAYRQFSTGDFVLKGLGTFGHPSELHVLWVGMKERSGIIQLREASDLFLEKRFSDLETRSFKPHLTLGRMKKVADPKKINAVVEKYQEMEFGRCVLSRILLYRSILDNDGPVYETLEEVKLR
ncbi:MAG: RNA 2',3'-cyclic phosphodiesterase [Bacteroidales bacterium]